MIHFARTENGISTVTVAWHALSATCSDVSIGDVVVVFAVWSVLSLMLTTLCSMRIFLGIKTHLCLFGFVDCLERNLQRNVCAVHEKV